MPPPTVTAPCVAGERRHRARMGNGRGRWRGRTGHDWVKSLDGCHSPCGHTSRHPKTRSSGARVSPCRSSRTPAKPVDGAARAGRGDVLDEPLWSLNVPATVFDRDFFRREFPQKLQRFSEERESVPVRVVFSTVGGRDFDIHRMTFSDTGTMLFTREEKMIFLPYGAIEHIDVTVAQDRRVPGFEIPTDSDDGDQRTVSGA